MPTASTAITWWNQRNATSEIYKQDLANKCLLTSFSVFREVQRTQGVSTTDLVGRMLLMTKNHFQKGDAEYDVAKDGKFLIFLRLQGWSKFTVPIKTKLFKMYWKITRLNLNLLIKVYRTSEWITRQRARRGLVCLTNLKIFCWKTWFQASNLF